MEKKIEPLLVPQPQKDWISELPADILVDILSRLEFKEAAQSSILSHRWMNLWTCVPRLHFDATKGYRFFLPAKEMRKQMAVFANRVNRVLALLELKSSFSLREFRIWFELDKGHKKDIDKWLEYAFRRGVERLDLNLCAGGIRGVLDRARYIFPNHLLELTGKLGTELAFSHVRALYFTAVNISDEAFEGLLRKCPLLEDLRVIASNLLVNVVVSGPSISLKHLEISNCNCIKSITISNTNIRFLRLSDHRENGHLLLNHLPMLREVWINGLFCKKSMLFSQLACCLSQLTALTLQSTSHEKIIRLYEIPELKNLRRLVLVAAICSTNSLLGLTSLIESCPRLVEFALMDWISELPADILVDILSRLEFKEAAQSSILSHRWMNLWTCVPRLHFDATKGYRFFLPAKEMRKQMAVFANRVNRVLALLELKSSFSLREFRIWFELDKGHKKDIDKWLEYAFRRGVERLDLNLCAGGIRGVPYKARYIFPNHFLELTGKLGTELAFSHVRALYFTAVNISDEALEGLLRKCPLLEDLRVIASNLLVNVVVSGPSISLKHLEISNCNCIKSITISNTNIRFLRLSDHRENGHLLLNHLPMLREVWINGLFRNKSMLFSQLACCLSQLTALTLQSTSHEKIMRLYEIPELKNLRRLVLVAAICSTNSLLGLTSLIESCPRLVEFALMLDPVNVPLFGAAGTDPKYATEETLKGALKCLSCMDIARERQRK